MGFRNIINIFCLSSFLLSIPLNKHQVYEGCVIISWIQRLFGNYFPLFLVFNWSQILGILFSRGFEGSEIVSFSFYPEIESLKVNGWFLREEKRILSCNLEYFQFINSHWWSRNLLLFPSLWFRVSEVEKI